MQEQELEALRSIYFDEFSEQDQHKTFQIAIHIRLHPNSTNTTIEQQPPVLYLQFTYHDMYPSHEPPYFNFEARNWNLGGNDVAALHNYLVRSEETGAGGGRRDSGGREHLSCYFTPGECCIFQWVEHLRDHAAEMVPQQTEARWEGMPSTRGGAGPEGAEREEKKQSGNGGTTSRFRGTIHRGSPFTDRKSKFVAHAAQVHSESEAQAFMSELLRDNKVANATHNILAYRIELGNGQILEHRDDDGETGAAENMLFLLQRGDVRNVIVCVTRWYGGIQLGPDRFRIITNVAKELLQDLGVLSIKGGKKSEKQSII